jgi:hypothetical protein
MSRRELVPTTITDPEHQDSYSRILKTLKEIDDRQVSAVDEVTGDPSDTASSVTVTAITTVAINAATTTGYGYTQAQADSIPVTINSIVARLALVTTAVNALKVDTTANAAAISELTTQYNALITAMQASGAMEST